MLTAKYISHKVYSDGVVEGKFICPDCNNHNTHTITEQYYTQKPSKRCCHNMTKFLCTTTYMLPTIPLTNI